MSRFTMIIALAGGLALCGTAAADPAKNAVRIRIPFGGPVSQGDRVVWDLFEINKTLERIHERQEPVEKPAVIVDREAIDAHDERERNYRMQDPNLAIRDVTVATGDLRPQLQPADKGTLFDRRIRANGNPSAPITDPFRATVTTADKSDR